MGGFGRIYRRFETISPLAKDGALAGVLAAALLVDLAQQNLPPDAPMRAADPLGYVLVSLLILPLALRTLFPVQVYAAVLGASVAVAVLFYGPSSYGFGLIIATYTVARWRERRISLIALAIGLAFGVLVKVRAADAGLAISWFDWPLDATYFGAAWFLGDSLRTRRRYADELERNREALAHQAVAEERVRIARELHDALGHSVSVMVLHAGGAQEQLGQDPARVSSALQSIASVGRDALNDMDRLIGLLRTSDDPPHSLQPNLDNLDALIDGYRDLGLEIHTRIELAPTGVPAGVELSAYRIIEEALTNTIKHAGPTTAEVSVAYGDDEVQLLVRDHGGSLERRPLGRSPHEGRGLLGIRERAALVSGDVAASPHPDGGFVVSATLPYRRSVGT